LSGAALAEPQKLDDRILGDVAGGYDFSTTSNWSLMASQSTNTTTETISNVRNVTQDLSAASANNNYATGLWSTGVSAMGTGSATVSGVIN
jgi:hypothetical protein